MTLKKYLVFLLSSTFLHYLLILFFFCRVSSKKKNLFILSSFRWQEDLEILKKNNKFNLVIFDQSKVNLLNRFFQFSSTNKKIDKNFEKFLIFFSRVFRVSAFVSCSCLYKVEEKIRDKAKKINVPFIAYHKEFTLLNSHLIQTRITNLKKKKNFSGTHILCINENAKKLLISSKIARPERISVNGLIRADELIKNFSKQKKVEKKIVLFSFGHFTGPFLNSHKKKYYDIDHYFCKNNKDGFIKLFESVHLNFLKISINYPNIQFLIKTKNNNPNWKNRIRILSQNKIGRDFESLTNCKIVTDGAQSLMHNSLANIVFNSTTVIESLLTNVNTIVPIFHEAKNKYSNKVYLKKYFNLFSVANNESEYISLIKDSLNGRKLKKLTSKSIIKICTKNLGNPDGNSSKRFFKKVNEILK